MLAQPRRTRVVANVGPARWRVSKLGPIASPCSSRKRTGLSRAGSTSCSGNAAGTVATPTVPGRHRDAGRRETRAVGHGVYEGRRPFFEG